MQDFEGRVTPHASHLALEANQGEWHACSGPKQLVNEADMPRGRRSYSRASCISLSQEVWWSQTSHFATPPSGVGMPVGGRPNMPNDERMPTEKKMVSGYSELVSTGMGMLRAALCHTRPALSLHQALLQRLSELLCSACIHRQARSIGITY